MLLPETVFKFSKLKLKLKLKTKPNVTSEIQHNFLNLT
jgi:hypothetical protein